MSKKLLLLGAGREHLKNFRNPGNILFFMSRLVITNTYPIIIHWAKYLCNFLCLCVLFYSMKRQIKRERIWAEETETVRIGIPIKEIREEVW